MKKFFSTIILIAFAANVISQKQTKNREYYMGKSKRQKSAAYSLLIGGTTVIGVGFLIGNCKNSSFGKPELVQSWVGSACFLYWEAFHYSLHLGGIKEKQV